MAQLPPRVPSWPPAFPHHNKMPPLTTTTAALPPPPPPTSWVDEFLVFSTARRGFHRRSVSDSIAFLEPSDCARGGFEWFDDSQLMSMFSDDLSDDLSTAASAAAAPFGGSNNCFKDNNPSSPLDQNSNDDDKQMSAPPPPRRCTARLRALALLMKTPNSRTIPTLIPSLTPRG